MSDFNSDPHAVSNDLKKAAQDINSAKRAVNTGKKAVEGGKKAAKAAKALMNGSAKATLASMMTTILPVIMGVFLTIFIFVMFMAIPTVLTTSIYEGNKFGEKVEEVYLDSRAAIEEFTSDFTVFFNGITALLNGNYEEYKNAKENVEDLGTLFFAKSNGEAEKEYMAGSDTLVNMITTYFKSSMIQSETVAKEQADAIQAVKDASGNIVGYTDKRVHGSGQSILNAGDLGLPSNAGPRDKVEVYMSDVHRAKIDSSDDSYFKPAVYILAYKTAYDALNNEQQDNYGQTKETLTTKKLLDLAKEIALETVENSRYTSGNQRTEVMSAAYVAYSSYELSVPAPDKVAVHKTETKTVRREGQNPDPSQPTYTDVWGDYYFATVTEWVIDYHIYRYYPSIAVTYGVRMNDNLKDNIRNRLGLAEEECNNVEGNIDMMVRLYQNLDISFTSLFLPENIGGVYISSPFGSRGVNPATGEDEGLHNGVDIASGGVEGIPLLAICDGYISHRESNIERWGNSVYITPTRYNPETRQNEVYVDTDGNSYTIEYHHCKPESYDIAPVGTHVTAGTVIALLGNTGQSTGPHIHLGIKVGNEYYDPSLYVPDIASLRG